MVPHNAHSTKDARFSNLSHFILYELPSNIPKFFIQFLHLKVHRNTMKSSINMRSRALNHNSIQSKLRVKSWWVQKSFPKVFHKYFNFILRIDFWVEQRLKMSRPESTPMSQQGVLDPKCVLYSPLSIHSSQWQ